MPKNGKEQTPAGIPDKEQCLAWLAEAHASDEIVEHVRAVRKRARHIAELLVAHGHPVDIDLVKAAAMLHDIGRAFTDGPDHGLVGAAWLRRHGCAEAVILCVERHILAGLDEEDSMRMGLGCVNLMPRTLEEKVVTHADNLTAGPDPRTLDKLIAKLQKRGDEKMIARLRELDGMLRSMTGGEL